MDGVSSESLVAITMVLSIAVSPNDPDLLIEGCATVGDTIRVRTRPRNVSQRDAAVFNALTVYHERLYKNGKFGGYEITIVPEYTCDKDRVEILKAISYLLQQIAAQERIAAYNNKRDAPKTFEKAVKIQEAYEKMYADTLTGDMETLTGVIDSIAKVTVPPQLATMKKPIPKKQTTIRSILTTSSRFCPRHKPILKSILKTSIRFGHSVTWGNVTQQSD